MAAPTIYRSSDSNAPLLIGGSGNLIDVLQACLVDGYGGSFATGSLTSDGTNVADGDTATIGSTVYTFKTTIGTTPYNVVIGANSATSLLNLSLAINAQGTSGTTYPAGTLPHPDVSGLHPGAGNVLPIQARKGGSGGNAITLARASAGTPHITVSGATLTGGSGSVTKAGAGWARSFSGTPAGAQAVFRPPAGTRFYLQVDDTGPGTGGAREARCFGFETMTAYNTGTGQFPNPVSIPSGSVLRKSTTLDATARAWTMLVDDRTFYLFTYSGDAAGLSHGFSFGDFYSVISGDAYKCLIMSGSAESASAVTATDFFRHIQINLGNNLLGHTLPRNFSGVGGWTCFEKLGDGSLSAFSGAATIATLTGLLGFPNAADGGLYVAPLRIIDGSTPAGTLTGTPNLRGRVRGLYHVPHAIASFADGDMFNGIGDYTGRSFMIVKGANAGFVAVETTAWDTSA